MSHDAAGKKRQLIYLRDLLIVLVQRDFTLRYKRSYFGVAWSLLVPLAQLAVMYVVFGNFFPMQVPHFITFLFSGLLPWTWFQSSLTAASNTIVENRDLTKLAGFPVAILPAVTVISQLAHFLLSLPILFAFALIDGLGLKPVLLLLPFVILVQFAFTLSLAYIVATLQVSFRDTQHLLGIGLLLMFYLTPIFWDSNQISEPFRTLMLLNPVASLLGAYRSIVMQARVPSIAPLLTVAVISAAILRIGQKLFLQARNRFVEEL
jgi:lipopolysaccharide transport system permease protein